MNTKDMTLREVMEYTRHLRIRDGGLSIFLEKMVSEIEDIQKIITRNESLTK